MAKLIRRRRGPPGEAEPGSWLQSGSPKQLVVPKSDAWQALLLGLVSTLALPPLYGLPVLWLVVPHLLRLYGRAGNWKRLIWRAWCFGFGFNLAGLFWVTDPALIMARDFWWAIPFAAPALAAATGFYMMIPALAVYRMRPSLAALFVFAGTWAMSNLAQQFLLTGFPWNFWGADWTVPGWFGTVMIQPAAWGGVFLLTFLTVFVAGLPLLGRRGWTAAVAVLTVWAAGGLWRISRPSPGRNSIKIAMIQPDFAVPGSSATTALEARWRHDLSMTRIALTKAGPGPKVVVWPETASPALLQSNNAARAAIASIADKTPVLAGSLRFTKKRQLRNALIVVKCSGPAIAWYDKWKLVPFGEYEPDWLSIKVLPVVSVNVVEIGV